MKVSYPRRSSGRPIRSVLTAALLLGATTATASAQTKTVDLRVLLISGGNQEALVNGVCTSYADPDLQLITELLDQMAVPYDVYDANANTLLRKGAVISSSALTAAVLATGNSGKYNGVILAESSALGLVTPGSCNDAYEPKMDATEWKALHDYESTFSVRESVVSGSPWPFVSGYTLDYGMDSTTTYLWKSVNATTANWISPAGGKEVYEYIKTTNPLVLEGGFAYVGKPRVEGTVPTAGAPVAQPLLAVRNSSGATDKTQTLISIVRYAADPANGRPNVREVLFSSISNANYLLYSQKIAYEFVNFATKGVFAGGRYVHLTAHNDDLFLPNGLWDPATLATREDDAGTYRITNADFNNLVTAQNQLRSKYATANAFALDFAFNGSGTTATYGGLPENIAADALTTAVRANVTSTNNFRYINHTYRHWDNDITANKQPCLGWLDETATTPPYATEITKNRTVWQLLNLPLRTQNNVIMVPGDHSGLKDDGCEMPGQSISPAIAYDSGGRNADFLTALYGVGIRYMASDSSQPGQGEEKYDASGVLLLPRKPTSVFFNVTQPGTFNASNPTAGVVGDLVSEYNYIFYKRHIDQGLDPATVVGAIAAPRDYTAIMKAEVETALRHMLTYRQWSFFFHQSNLKNYGGGKTLQFDWLNAVVGEYDKNFNMPLKSPAFYQIGADTADRVKARNATIDGYVTLNDTTGSPTTVTIRASSGGPVTMLMTGITKPSGNAALYAGQSIQSVSLTDALQTFTVNRALQ